ncbi:MAG: terminase small subunit [Cellvibrionaceae bacterium]
MTELTFTAEQLELASVLTTLQRMTVINIVTGKMSQREAYREAGGKAKTDASADATVSRMLSDAKVKAFYESLLNEAAKEAVMSRTEALERLSRSARVTVLDIAEFSEEVVGEDEDGNPVTQTSWRIKNSDEMSLEAAASIKSITATKFGPKLEMHDAQGAIKQLADLEGWNAPKRAAVEHSGEIATPQKVDLGSMSKDDRSALKQLLERNTVADG